MSLAGGDLPMMLMARVGLALPSAEADLAAVGTELGVPQPVGVGAADCWGCHSQLLWGRLTLGFTLTQSRSASTSSSLSLFKTLRWPLLWSVIVTTGPRTAVTVYRKSQWGSKGARSLTRMTTLSPTRNTPVWLLCSAVNWQCWLLLVWKRLPTNRSDTLHLCPLAGDWTAA